MIVNGESESRAAPPPPAGGAVFRQSEIHFKVDKAQRICVRFHSFHGLYPDDRQLIIQLQGLLRDIKKINAYEPNIKLDLFPP